MALNNVKIFYDGVDVFRNVPTPFLSFDKEFIKYGYDEWGQKYNIKLNGQIVGDLGPTAMSSLEDIRDSIIEGFKSDYKEIKVEENSVQVFAAQDCCIEAITFDSNRYYGIMEYTIDISAYDFNYVSASNIGVLNPEETWEFSEEEDGVINVIHTVSAAGTPIGNKSGFAIAKDWVDSKDALPASLMSTMKIKSISNADLLLVSIAEQANRFNGTYSVTRSYLVDSFHSGVAGKGLLRYTVDGSKDFSSDDQLVSVTVQGSVSGKSNTGPVNMADLRSRMDSLNFLALATEVARLIDGSSSLNSTAISASITENPDDSELSFSFTYNDDESDASEAICDYSVTASENLLKNLTELSINATITSNKGDKKKRWDLVKNYYYGNFNAYALANAQYKKFGYSRSLNIEPVSESITFDEFNYTINYSASWSDKYLPCPGVISTISEKVDFVPSIKVHTTKPSLTVKGEQNVQFFGCANRGTLSVSIEATGKPSKTIQDVKACVLAELSRIKGKYLAGSTSVITDRQSESYSEESRRFSVDYSCSLETPIVS